MIIAKIYDSYQKARDWMDYYCNFNESSIRSIIVTQMKVDLITGDSIIFGAVQDMKDVMKYAGCEFTWVELDSGSRFDSEVEQWIKTRVRTPSRFVKKNS